MSADFLQPVQAIAMPSMAATAPYDGPEGIGSAGPAAASSFGSLFADGLRQVDTQLRASQVDLQRLATGDAQNLHHVMVRLEEARIGFQLLMQVRNRLLESYQDVMRMQV